MNIFRQYFFIGCSIALAFATALIVLSITSADFVQNITIVVIATSFALLFFKKGYGIVKYLSYTLFLFSFFLIVLFGSESGLRSRHYFPGVLTPQVAAPFFTKVDSLTVTPELIADSTGMMHVNPVIWNEYSWAAEPGNAVNEFGFRSEKFLTKAERDPNKKAILFVGDSFTWGYDAKPLSNSFVDKVQAEGFTTFNTGIADTDPVQYWLVAKKFIPHLLPDHCFVMLFLGNDIIQYDRPVKPFHPVSWTTNAGPFSAYLPRWNWKDGCTTGSPFLTPEDAYDYYIRVHTILDDDAGLLKKILSRTSTGTAFWKILKMRKSKDICPVDEKNYTTFYLNKIDSICKMHDVDFQVFIIPERDHIPNDKEELKSKYGSDFEADHFLLPQTLHPSDYSADAGGHLNNSGHKKMAEFILQYLNKEQQSL